MDTKHIMIVDDHPLVVIGFQQLIETEPDLEVCCEAGTIKDAIAVFTEQAVTHGLPDLVIVDLLLPDGNGLDLIKTISTQFPEMCILVSSMHDESVFAERALQAGAKGYVNKQEASDRIVYAIRQVLDGHIYLSNKYKDQRQQNLDNKAVIKQANKFESSIAYLSVRELEVFGLIGHGLKTSEIAKKLHLSVKTIESHRSNIKSKLKLENSSKLVHSAIQWTLNS